MSPEWHKSRIERKVQSCLRVGAHIHSAAECLAGVGVSLKDANTQHPYFISCWPYWGFPIVYSCGNVYIKVRPDGIIESWKAEGTVEKLHG